MLMVHWKMKLKQQSYLEIQGWLLTWGLTQEVVLCKQWVSEILSMRVDLIN